MQWRPVPLHLPQKITKLAAGCNHALALGVNGAVFSWGADESYKLGRRFISRRLVRRLEPREFGLPRQIVDIAAGSEHSFAIHRNGQVYSWGANGHAKTGIIQGVGNLDAMVTHPTVVESLKSHGPLKHMDGGNNHSIAVTADGKCLVWGRIDSFVTGLDVESIAPADVIYDSRGKKKTLRVPTVLPGLQVAFAAAGGEHCLAITSDGKAYSWGFSMGGQTGLGTDDDVEHATLINSKSVRDQHLVWAGAGGTYSILASKETTPRA